MRVFYLLLTNASLYIRNDAFIIDNEIISMQSNLIEKLSTSIKSVHYKVRWLPSWL